MPKPLFVLIWVLKGTIDFAAAREKGGVAMSTRAGMPIMETTKASAHSTLPPVSILILSYCFIGAEMVYRPLLWSVFGCKLLFHYPEKLSIRSCAASKDISSSL